MVVLAVNQSEGVGYDAGGIEAALRKSRWATEDEADVGESGLRDADFSAEAIAEAHAGGVDGGGWVEGDGDAVESEPRFVDDRWGEDVGFAEGGDLAVGVAMIAPAGDCVALQGGFGADILLEGVEAMEGIVGAEGVRQVHGSLVDLHGTGGERHVVVAAVGQWNEGGERGGGGLVGLVGCDGCLIRGRDDGAVLKYALVLAKAFIAGIEEGVIFPEGATG